MTMTDAIGRIQQIQTTLTHLSRPAAAANSATVFAEKLSAAATAGIPASGSTAVGANTEIPTGSVTGSDVVATAKKYLGVPYVFGGEDANGVDCSGLVQRVFKDLGIDVPRLVSGQSTLGTEVASLKDAKPGDLIVNDTGGHIAIYLGDNKILYAPKPGDRVKINDVYYPESQIVTIRRVVPSEAPAGSAPASVTGTQNDLQTAALRSLLSGASR